MLFSILVLKKGEVRGGKYLTDVTTGVIKAKKPKRHFVVFYVISDQNCFLV